LSNRPYRERTEDDRNPFGTLLIVDDDMEDCFLYQRALADIGVKNKVNFMGDGSELLHYPDQNLRSSKNSHTPHLILLDLNMSRLDGREALRFIKLDRDFKKILVIILTTSRNPDDVLETYSLGASPFIQKPDNYGGLVSLFKLLNEYWLRTAVLPD